MNMKKLADEAIIRLHEIMDGAEIHEVTADQIRMAAMSCRITELEEMLRKKLDLIKCGIGGNLR